VLVPASLQAGGGKRLEAGALTFRNNYAMNQGWTGMPDRWAAIRECACVLPGAACYVLPSGRVSSSLR
jgi:hypothetical protein